MLSKEDVVDGNGAFSSTMCVLTRNSIATASTNTNEITAQMTTELLRRICVLFFWVIVNSPLCCMRFNANIVPVKVAVIVVKDERLDSTLLF